MARRGNFVSSPVVMPILNTGRFWDVITGNLVKGKHGDTICVGGLAYQTGIAGPGNTFKSLFMWDMLLAILNNYICSQGNMYDTELSQQRSRPRNLSKMYARLKEIVDIIFDEQMNEAGQLQMTNAAQYLGDQWYNLFAESMDEKFAKGKKEIGKKNPEYFLETPFINPDGTPMFAMVPDVYGVDSFSNFLTSSVEKLQNEHDIGDGGRNMEVFRGGMAKTQMMMELPVKTARGGGYILLSAHLGKEFAMDPRTPPAKQLAFMKQGVKFKNVPEKFTFLVNNCWLSMSASSYFNSSSDRTPAYPRNSDDKIVGDTDLMNVLIANLRGKSGGSGTPFEVVVRQSEGVMHSLTELDFCKKYGRFGLDPNVQNYFLHLRPDVKLSRTTVDKKFREDPLLARAMFITFEMCYARYLHQDWPEEYRNVTPEELYNGLKEKGYDWDVLLSTVPNWDFVDYEKVAPKPRLTTWDLMNMYHGTYHPFWMKDKPKAAAK